MSFHAYGSVGTALDLGGAKLTIKPGTKPGYAKLALVNPVPAQAAGPAGPSPPKPRR